jgi:hypothetical protein
MYKHGYRIVATLVVATATLTFTACTSNNSNVPTEAQMPTKSLPASPKNVTDAALDAAIDFQEQLGVSLQPTIPGPPESEFGEGAIYTYYAEGNKSIKGIRISASSGQMPTGFWPEAKDEVKLTANVDDYSDTYGATSSGRNPYVMVRRDIGGKRTYLLNVQLVGWPRSNIDKVLATMQSICAKHLNQI